MAKTLSSQAAAAADSPHVDVARLCTMNFGALTLNLCDRIFGMPGRECQFNGVLYEPLIQSWDPIRMGRIDPVSYDVEPSEVRFKIDNSVPVGGADCFTALFASYDPHYATINIREILNPRIHVADKYAYLFTRLASASVPEANFKISLADGGAFLDCGDAVLADAAYDDKPIMVEINSKMAKGYTAPLVRAEIDSGTLTAGAEYQVISEGETSVFPTDKAGQSVALAVGVANGGIVIADDANNNFEYADCTFVLKFTVPDFTLTQIVLRKTTGASYPGILMDINAVGVFYTRIGNAGETEFVNFNSPSLSGYENQIVELGIIIKRETATAAGYLQYTLNGVAFGSQLSITAGQLTTLSVAQPVILFGNASLRYNATVKSFGTFNRALSVADMLDYYNNGVAAADQWGSQVSIASGAWLNTFTPNPTFDTFTSSGPDQFQASNVTEELNIRIKVAIPPVEIGERYRVEFTPTFSDCILHDITFVIAPGYAGTQTIIINPVLSSGVQYNLDFDANPLGDAVAMCFIFNCSAGGSFEIANFSLIKYGATLALEPTGIRLDKWWGRANDLDGVFPEVGCTPVVDLYFTSEGTEDCDASNKVKLESEQYGASAVVNGDFAAWTGDDPDDWPVIGEDASNYVTESGGKARLVSDNYIGMSQDYAVTALTLRRLQFDLSLTGCNYYLFDLTNSAYIKGPAALTPGAIDIHYTVPAGCASVRLFLYMLGLTAEIDNVVDRQVTEPATTGVLIVSAQGGATQNWAELEAGINPNAIDKSYEIYESDWLYGDGWFALSGVSFFIEGGSGELQRSATVPAAGAEYRIEWSLMKLGGDAEDGIAVELGSTAGALRTASGTYTDDIIAADDDFLKFVATDADGDLRAAVTLISIGRITEAVDGDEITIFKGQIEDLSDMSAAAVTVMGSGLELAIANKFSHEILNATDYPGADPDDLGKMLPQVYGAAKRVPFLAADAGGITTLAGDIDADDVTIAATDTSMFPASGTIQIDAEQITYTGKTATSFTGCTRAANATTAVAHDLGAGIAEIQTNYIYIIGHAVKAIDAVYVDNVLQPAGNYTAYTGQSGDELAGYEGLACIKFTTLPVLTRQINVELTDTIDVADTIDVSDTIAVSTGSHAHGGTESIVSWMFDTGVEGVSGVTNPERAADGDLNTACVLRGSTTPRCDVSRSFYQEFAGPPTHFRICIKTGALNLNQVTFTIDGQASATSTSNNTSKSAWGAVSSGLDTWAKVNAAVGYLTRNYTNTNDCNVYEVWVEFKYTPSIAANAATGVAKSGAATKTGAASKTGTVTLSGNSVADTVIGGRVSADLQGFQDDGDGTYTGTPAALIERPDHILKHILGDRCGQTLADVVNATAYTAAGIVYAAASYVLAFAILQRPNVRELIQRVAYQSKSIQFWEAGRHVLKPIEAAPSTIFSIDATRVDLNQVWVKFTPRVQINNTLSASYNRYWAGYDSDIESDRAVVTAADAASIAKYGALTGDPYSFPYIPGSTQAQAVLDWIKGDLADPRMLVNLAGGFWFTQFERGDIINFTDVTVHEGSAPDELLKALLRLVTFDTSQFRIINMERRVDAIQIEMVYVGEEA